MTSQGLFAQWWRIGGALGIGFAILFIIGAVIQGDTPMRDDSVQEIRAYFQDDGDMYLLGDYLIGMAFVFLFLPYVVILRWVLGSGEGWPPILSWMTVVGGLTTVALGGAGSAALGVLAISADNTEIDDSTVRVFMEFNVYASTLFSIGIALFVGSASLAILKAGVLWRWLAVVGLIAAVLLVIGASWTIDGNEEGALAACGFAGAPLTLLFVILTSINMLLMKGEPTPTERAAA